jgi:hypothetical protein
LDNRHSSQLPQTHRTSRLAILAALAGAVLVAGGSGTVDRGLHLVLFAERRITAPIWQPLLHGGGWVAPLLPARPAPSAPAPTVRPSGAPAHPAPAVPSPTRAPKRR